MRLSRRYDLPVLGILIVPPDFTDAAEFGRLTGRAVERAGGAIPAWEVLNEPDADYAFHGTPEQYARMLSAAYEAIKARAPDAQVAIGGLVDPRRTDWLARVLDTPGADARHRFDIASLHLRGPVDLVVNRYREFSAWLAARGFHGPVWVTEHGYPADPNFQVDPAYTGGARGAGGVPHAVARGAGRSRRAGDLRDAARQPRAVAGERDRGRRRAAGVRRGSQGGGRVGPAACLARGAARERPCRSGGDRGRARVVGAASAAAARARPAGRRLRALERRGSGGRLAPLRAFFAGSEVARLWHTAHARRHRELARERAATARALAQRIAWHPGAGG